MPIRVMICCQARLYNAGLSSLLAEFPDVQVCATAHDGNELDAGLGRHPEVLVCDRRMLGHLLTGERPLPRILLLEDGCQLLDDVVQLKGLVQKGIAGLLQPDADPGLLAKAIRAVHAGELWIDHKTIRDTLTPHPRPRSIVLSRREREVLEQIRTGYTNREIAERLCISEQTVKTHCHNLFRKFGVRNRLKLSLCEPPEF